MEPGEWISPTTAKTLNENSFLEEFSGGAVGISEFCFELIMTGETMVPERRVPGKSSTFDQYQRLIRTKPLAL
jgi:hypothetical protein